MERPSECQGDGAAACPAQNAVRQEGQNAVQGSNPARGLFVALLFMVGLSLIGILYATSVAIRSRPMPNELLLPTLVNRPPDPEEPLTSAQVVQKVAPSVVSVSLYDAGGIVATSTGSGIILSADGYVATNAHVAQNGAVLRVSLYNGKGYTARLVGSSVREDLAVLKIDASGLVPAELGDSEMLQAGERVYAVGNATGTLPGSITQGLLSGKGRQVPIETADGGMVYMSLLQTDAAINPGNSGGALVNMYGQVIGVTVGKVGSANVENIGFAIPVNEAAAVLHTLLEHHAMQAPPKLGVVCEPLNETTGPPNGLPAAGLYIVELAPGSSLHALNILPGDVLLAAEGRQLIEISDLTRVVQGYEPGEEIALEVYRFSSGKTVTVYAGLYAE